MKLKQDLLLGIAEELYKIRYTVYLKETREMFLLFRNFLFITWGYKSRVDFASAIGHWVTGYRTNLAHPDHHPRVLICCVCVDMPAIRNENDTFDRTLFWLEYHRGVWFRSPGKRSPYVILTSQQKGDLNQDSANFTFGEDWI